MPSTEHAPTILLVDDDNVLRDVLTRVLKRDGYDIVPASGVAEALEVVADHTPQLALLDLSLPDGDGVQLAAALHQRHADLPLILMTAYPIRLREEPEIKNQFKRVLIKPLNLEEFRVAVREVLRGEPAAAAASSGLESLPEIAATTQEPQPASDAPTPTVVGREGEKPRGRREWVKSAAMVAVALVVLGVFAVFISGVQIPGLSASAKDETVPPPPDLAVDLAPGLPHTLFVPEDVKKALGILRGKEDDVSTAEVPMETRPLVLTGSTILDPTRILRVRARFAPAEVVEVGPAPKDPEDAAVTGTQPRELHSGDRVKMGDLLGVFQSDIVGSKKNDLFDAESQYRLDKDILERAENSSSAVEVFVLNARRNVEGDLNNINRAVNTLRTWDIPEKDIQAIIDEAQASNGARTHFDKAKLEAWGRVELRAQEDGVIVERNVTQHELVQDATTNLFQIAKVDRLGVIANAPEDDLAILLKLPRDQWTWTVQTVNAPPEGIRGRIDDIGYLVDTNQHSAVVQGYIDNPGGKIRGAQLATATIPLPPPDDVVEIDVNAVVEEGKQAFVFVQADEKKSLYTLRRVKVTQRFDRTVYVKSKLDAKETTLTPEEKEQGLTPVEPLHKGEKVLRSGVLELRQELKDRESDAAKGS